MSPFLVLGVALGGGAGAAGRFLLDGLINTGREFRLPVGTLTINITGSLLLGLIVGAAAGCMIYTNPVPGVRIRRGIIEGEGLFT